MTPLRHPFQLAVLAAALAAITAQSQTQNPAPNPATAATPAPSDATPLPADPWPRQVNLASGTVLMYQPQVSQWQGNQITFRSALAFMPKGGKQETFGVMFATARTQVDRINRSVVFENLQINSSLFPTLPDKGASLSADLQASVASTVRTISLDRLKASLALNGIQPPTVAVQNNPPQVLVSYSPAILVPIDGTPVFKPVGNSGFQRIINTKALILQGGPGNALYLPVYDGWLSAASLQGPWLQTSTLPAGLAATAQSVAKTGAVDMLKGSPDAKPKPSLANGVPSIMISQVPSELIIFNGQPDFVPINGTQLLWAANTTSDVFVNTANSGYYVLMAGRWFTAPGLGGPWTYVAANALPADFARIPPSSRAAVVLPTVAGTPQAQEAVIENSIPQTATVKRVNGPTFTPALDGAPQWAPVPGTALSYVANASAPLIQVPGGQMYAVQAGVWFTAPGITGPWTVAASVPDAIYTIPPSSPIYYVTYVRIYEATPQYVYTGYTPGYMGTVVSSDGTIVYGTGYTYNPWIGSVWYPAPYTYGLAAAPVYNPYVGFTFGFAAGLATAAFWGWGGAYWGGAYYHPGYWGGYGCCASASANVYGHWGNTAYSGTRSWYAGGGVAGSTASGVYANARTGTTGSYAAGRQYNAWTGNATRGYDRTVNGADGGSGNVARAGNYNTYTGQRSYGSSASYTGAGGSSIDRTSATTAGPQGAAHASSTTTYNARTGETNTWTNGRPSSNNMFADSNGNVMRNDGSGGWQQHSSGGWGCGIRRHLLGGPRVAGAQCGRLGGTLRRSVRWRWPVRRRPRGWWFWRRLRRRPLRWGRGLWRPFRWRRLWRGRIPGRRRLPSLRPGLILFS
jgi:hypothetical protein